MIKGRHHEIRDYRRRRFRGGALAWVLERTMAAPLISSAQVRMLAEGIADPLPGCDSLPEELAPQLRFTKAQIRRGLLAETSPARPDGPTASPCAKE
jgi:hypothetical protein